MSFRRYFKFAALAIGMLAFAQIALGQTAGDGKIATMTVGGSSVRWDISAPNSGGSVTIQFPDGRSFRRTFRGGAAPVFDLSDKLLDGLPEGSYTYELLLAPVLTGAQKEAIMKARGNDDDPEAERAGRKRPAVPSLVQHGSFAVVNGALIGPGAIEGERTGSNSSQPQPKAQLATVTRVSANTVTRMRNHRFSLVSPFDIVNADDTIVQGSLCVGLDCVNGEVFGFDTIRLKENNTRIQFDDTSAAGFPLNNWQIRANSSAAGAASFLAFVDQGAAGNSETGTIVFEVDAGAPANALKVASTGKVGIRTATPGLDVHMNTSDTPAMRMEQNSSGGFTAQTWDIGANEANWFVRDVTGGSRLPFRIRPGAPTSSVDISASGNVGVGTASPQGLLHLHAGTDRNLRLRTDSGIEGTTGMAIQSFNDAINANMPLSIAGNPIALMEGNVGIGTTSPDQKLSVNGDADKVGGGSWLNFSDERLKTIKGQFNSGLRAVMQLTPIRYEYLKNNALGLKSEGEHIGFGAQTLQNVIPEAVTQTKDGYLMVNNDPIMWTMLNAIKEQQQQIEQLKGQIRKLQSISDRRRK
jgi:Chaperone of endosialidase